MQKNSWTSIPKRILIFAYPIWGNIFISIIVSISLALIVLIKYARFGERTFKGQLGTFIPTAVILSILIFFILQHNIWQRLVTYTHFEKTAIISSTLVLAYFTAKAFPISEPSLVTIHELDIYQQNNNQSDSTMIVKEIRTPDDKTVSYFDLVIEGQYQIKDDYLIMVNDESMSIMYLFPASINETVQVLFTSNSKGGIVSVDVDGLENVINLYEPESTSDKLVIIPVLNNNLSPMKKNLLWMIDSTFFAFLYLLCFLNFDWQMFRSYKKNGLTSSIFILLFVAVC